jgi:hypothetical protein
MMIDLAIIAVIAGLSGLVAATIMAVVAERREQRRVWKFSHRDHSGQDAHGQPWPYYKGNEEEDSAELRGWDTWFNEGGQPGAWYGPNDPRNSK